jgi:hypothetical protein
MAVLQSAQNEIASRLPLSATRSRIAGRPETCSTDSAGTCMQVAKALDESF